MLKLTTWGQSWDLCWYKNSRKQVQSVTSLSRMTVSISTIFYLLCGTVGGRGRTIGCISGSTKTFIFCFPSCIQMTPFTNKNATTITTMNQWLMFFLLLSFLLKQVTDLLCFFSTGWKPVRTLIQSSILCFSGLNTYLFITFIKSNSTNSAIYSCDFTLTH